MASTGMTRPTRKKVASFACNPTTFHRAEACASAHSTKSLRSRNRDNCEPVSRPCCNHLQEIPGTTDATAVDPAQEQVAVTEHEVRLSRRQP